MRRKYFRISVLAVSMIAFILTYEGLSNLNKPVVISGQISGKNIFIQRERVPDITPTEVEPIYGLPMRLIIPEINIDSSIQHLGVTEDGNMEVPVMIKDLGWYKYGPNPGMQGSSVIAGHLGVEIPGIFANLDKLQKGDTISVIDDKNQTISFIVSEIKIYNANDRPKEVFFSTEGSHLNLITCAGEWDNANLSMTKRLVVFSERI